MRSLRSRKENKATAAGTEEEGKWWWEMRSQ